MGNNISLNLEKDTIIWIDANINNFENKNTYSEYISKFANFNFIRFSSVKKAIKFISEITYF